MTNTNRYEAIADYPSSHIPVGDIVHAFTDALDAFYSKYPHLFRLLKWWEHVPVDELPKYVKVVDGDGEVEYINVKEWNLTKPNKHYCEGKLFTVDEIDAHGDLFTWFFPYEYSEELTPATEAEYNEYLTKLNSK